MTKTRLIKSGIIVVAVAVLLGGGIKLLTGSGGKAKDADSPLPRPVKAILLEAQSGLIMRTYAGEIDANLNSELSFRVGGPLIKLPVQPGQTVHKGDLIAEIDPRDYKFKVEKLQSDLKRLDAQLTVMKTGAREEDIMVARSKLNLAIANENLAKSELERVEYGLKKDVATQSEFDKAKCTYETAKAQTIIARKTLRVAEVGARKEDIQAMEADIQALNVQLKMAQASLDDTRLLAPFEGIIGKQFVEEHDQVTAGQPIVVLQDNSRTEVVIHVSQGEIETTVAKRKMAVRFTQAGPELSKMSFPLTFKEIDTVADSATRTYRVTLVMDTPKDVSIYPGMTVEVDVATQYAGVQHGFLVPASAIVSKDDGQPIVWRINPKSNTAESVAVKPGQIVGEEIQITGELKPGDKIIVAGASFIYEGQKVSSEAYRYDQDNRARRERMRQSIISLPPDARNVTFSSYAPKAPYASGGTPPKSNIAQ